MCIRDRKPDEQESESQNFANIDKEKWEQILAEMDPDDFKYKMWELPKILIRSKSRALNLEQMAYGSLGI